MFTPIYAVGVADIAARKGSPHNVLHSSNYWACAKLYKPHLIIARGEAVQVSS